MNFIYLPAVWYWLPIQGWYPFSYVDVSFLGLTSISPFQKFQVPLNKGNICYIYVSEKINIHGMLMYKNRKRR